MDSMWSLLLLLRSWMGHGCIAIQVVYWVELLEQKRLPDFFENMDPDKWAQQYGIGLPEVHEFSAS